MDRATRSGAVQPHGPDRRAPEQPPDGPASPGRATLGAALVALVVVTTALVGPWDPEARLTTREPDAPPPTLGPLVEIPRDPLWGMFENAPQGERWDLTVVGYVLLALLVGVFVWVLVRVLRRLTARHRGQGAPDAAGLTTGGVVGGPDVLPDLPALREGVDDAGKRLRADVRPADAVIAAWVALEGAASASGVERRPAQTPTEFTVAVLDRTAADPGAVRTLLDLYLRARFGEDPLRPDDVLAARRAVELLGEGLGSGA